MSIEQLQLTGFLSSSIQKKKYAVLSLFVSSPKKTVIIINSLLSLTSLLQFFLHQTWHLQTVPETKSLHAKSSGGDQKFGSCDSSHLYKLVCFSGTRHSDLMALCVVTFYKYHNN